MLAILFFVQFGTSLKQNIDICVDLYVSK